MNYDECVWHIIYIFKITLLSYLLGAYDFIHLHILKI